MITWIMESNNLHVKQIEMVQVNRVTQVPLRAVWLRRHRKMVYSCLDWAYGDDISGCNPDKRLLTAASIMQGFHRRLMPLLSNNHTSCMMYWLCCKCLNQGKKPVNAGFSILDNEMTIQPFINASHSQLEEAIQTCPNPEMYCILS